MSDYFLYADMNLLADSSSGMAATAAALQEKVLEFYAAADTGDFCTSVGGEELVNKAKQDLAAALEAVSAAVRSQGDGAEYATELVSQMDKRMAQQFL